MQLQKKNTGEHRCPYWQPLVTHHWPSVRKTRLLWKPSYGCTLGHRWKNLKAKISFKISSNWMIHHQKILSDISALGALRKQNRGNYQDRLWSTCKHRVFFRVILDDVSIHCWVVLSCWMYNDLSVWIVEMESDDCSTSRIGWDIFLREGKFQCNFNSEW